MAHFMGGGAPWRSMLSRREGETQGPALKSTLITAIELIYFLEKMITWIIAAWDYLWEAMRTHPFNLFTLVITAVAVIYARASAMATKHQADEAQRVRQLSEQTATSQAEQTSKALEIAERSTKAAERSAEATRVLAEVGQRAWVSAVKVIATRGSSRGYPNGIEDDFVQVVLTIRNGGNSPALEFVSSLSFQLLERAPIEIETTALESANAGIVGPHEPVQMERHYEGLTTEQWAAIATGTRILLLYGVCRYKDIFGAIHHTRWCYRFISGTQQFATYISHFNTMD